MRAILLAATVALAPLAYAQADTVTTSTTKYYATPASQDVVASDMRGAVIIPAVPEPGNCGTPLEAKSCPPLPRVPLAYYQDR
jgi:hypothetical protein